MTRSVTRVCCDICFRDVRWRVETDDGSWFLACDAHMDHGLA